MTKKLRIPPIFVSQVKVASTLINTINPGRDCSIGFQILANGDVKINCKDENSYRNTVNLLNSVSQNVEHALHGIEFHSYQCKTTRPYRVVVRGLYCTTSIDEIKEELANCGHIAKDVANVIITRRIQIKEATANKPAKFETRKIPLPVFYVNLEPKSNNKDVYEISHMLHCKVSIEAPYKKIEVPQCKRCQSFGHTVRYCARRVKCVKCSGEHLTEHCTKKKEEPCKCVNCGGNHVTSWKGCPEYKKKLDAVTKPRVTAMQRVQQKEEAAPQIQATETPAVKPKRKRKRNKKENVPEQPLTESSSSESKKEPTITDIWNLLQSMNVRISNLEKKQQSGKSKRRTSHYVQYNYLECRWPPKKKKRTRSVPESKEYRHCVDIRNTFKIW